MPKFTCLLLMLALTGQPAIAQAETGVFAGMVDWLSRQWQRFQPDEANLEYQPTFNITPANVVKEYLVGIHPLHNPKRLFEIYGPILDRIAGQLPGIRLRLEASRDYQEFEKKLYEGRFDFAMPNPYQTLHALEHGYRVFGKMADDQDFRGLILVRKDGGIENVADLKGKAIAYPAASALAACMMPQQFLQDHGLDINHDVDNRYVGSQESSIMNVQLGHVAAAATWPVPWKMFVVEHPELAAQLAVKWQTDSLVNNGWVVHQTVPAEVLQGFAAQLFSLQESDAGRKLLQAVPVSRFEPADDHRYEPVRRFMDKFERSVRPLIR